ncbi:hypothetical protein AAIH32_20085 [Pseudarthrobacter oxydans]|uniref:hypothetical protein n=1 Tax=Pseudarthrobacter oxydans TaxID=1671 RepID=UPI003D2E147C
MLPRIIPDLGYDRGIFVSVAERLIAGDVLYVDVWDNKDPLFFFGLAITRSISPYFDVLGEVCWIASSALAVFVIAKWRGCGPITAWFASLGVSPLILTGSFYLPGHTHLPGIALTLWVFGATVFRRFVVAGALVGILTFTKITMLPVAFLLLVIVVLVFHFWRAALLASVGFTLTAGGVLALLLVRGEFEPYVESLIRNTAYSQGSLVDGQGSTFVRHLVMVASKQTLSVLVILLLMVIAVVLVHIRRGTPLWADQKSLILWASLGSSLLGATVVLGLTGLWHHHCQVLYVPAILAVIGFMHLFQPVFNVRSALPATVFTALAIGLAGHASLTAYPESVMRSISNLPHLLSRLGSIPPEAQAVLSVGDRGTYARVGHNDDLGHAYGLGEWKLACPKFHQYPFDSVQTLRDVSVCLPGAQVIIVSPSARPISNNETWNSYLSNVEVTLRLNYSCADWEGERICVRRST